MKTLYKLTNIKKEFKLGKLMVPALRGISLEIKSGEFVALRGPSGSGKSTLLNILGFLEVPTSGTLEFEAQLLTQTSESTLTQIRRDKVGFIFQNYNLIPIFSALENVAYPLQLNHNLPQAKIQELAKYMLKEVGLENFTSHKPAELSGGQRQRVAIARALIKKPHIILADEPSANLDSKTSEQILALIRELKNKNQITIVVATHDESVAKLAERSIFIRDGEISTVH